MQENKREQFRQVDKLIGFGRLYIPHATFIPLASTEELQEVRQRARLSVLDLTKKDKRFLRSLKVAF